MGTGIEVVKATGFEVSNMFRTLLEKGEVLIESVNWSPDMDANLRNESRNWVIHQLKSKFKGKKFAGARVLVIDYNPDGDVLRALLMDETEHAKYSKMKEVEKGEQDALALENERLVLEEHTRRLGTIVRAFGSLYWYLGDLSTGLCLPKFERLVYRIKNRGVLGEFALCVKEGDSAVRMLKWMNELFGPEYNSLNEYVLSSKELVLINGEEDLFITYNELYERVMNAYKVELKQLWAYINSPMMDKFKPVYVSHCVQVYFKFEFLYWRLMNIKLKNGDFVYESI